MISSIQLARNVDKINSIDSRVLRLAKADPVYFWSVKEQKMVRISSNDIDSAEKQRCTFCLPMYSPTNYFNQVTSGCLFEYSNLNEFKNHMLSQEQRFCRQLIWSSLQETPNDVDRVREIGDLSSLENAKIFKVIYDSITTVVIFRKYISTYFRNQKCPCSSECHVSVQSVRDLFSHLASLERKFKRYMIFDVDRIELNNANEKQAVQLVVHSNENMIKINNRIDVYTVGN